MMVNRGTPVSLLFSAANDRELSAVTVSKNARHMMMDFLLMLAMWFFVIYFSSFDGHFCRRSFLQKAVRKLSMLGLTFKASADTLLGVEPNDGLLTNSPAGLIPQPSLSFAL